MASKHVLFSFASEWTADHRIRSAQINPSAAGSRPLFNVKLFFKKNDWSTGIWGKAAREIATRRNSTRRVRHGALSQ